MKTIKKYNLAPPCRQIVLDIPLHANFLTIVQQDTHEPYMYAEVDQNNPMMKVEFVMIETDGERPDKDYAYVGSAVFDYNKVLHIYSKILP